MNEESPPGQASSLGSRLEAAPSLNPEPEEQQARDKMSALIDRLDQSVKEKGVIAQVVGEKDESGDHRAAILTEPVFQGEGRNRGIGYVVLTPDGPMIADASGPWGNNRQLLDIMGDSTPEDYARRRDFLRGLRYQSTVVSPSIMGYHLEGNGGIIHMQRLETSNTTGVDVKAQFDASVARAAQSLEGRRSQAADTIQLVDSLQSRF